MPLTIEEYQIGQLFSVAEASKMETGGGEGVEVVTNQAFDDPEIIGAEYPTGQYTFKIYHLKEKLPRILNMILPAGSTEVHEHAWNAYPYCRTIISNPTYLKERFMIKIETIHAPDRGTQSNAHNLPPDVLKKRDVRFINIAEDTTTDISKFTSKKTNRGPLVGNWMESCEPVMCAYKLVTVEFKWFGLQGTIEGFTMRQEAKLFSKFHNQMWTWVDNWHGLNLQQIREIEAQTQKELDEQRVRGPIRGSKPDDS